MPRIPDQRVSRGVNRQLDAIIESLYDGIWIMDGHGKVLNVNQTALRLHNLDAEEIVGKNIQELVAKGIIDRSSTMEALATKGQVDLLRESGTGKGQPPTGIWKPW